MDSPGEFASTIFHAAIELGALLFGVLGFLYSVYALFKLSLTEKSVAPPPLTRKLTQICKLLALVILVNFIVSVAALALIAPRNFFDIVLAAAMAVSEAATVGISVWLAFRVMDL